MTFTDILSALAIAFSSFILIYALWIFGVAVASAFAKEKRYEAKTLHTYAVVICARNEEKVVGRVIDSLRAQNYPADKFEIFTVAHNCEDETARVAAEHGSCVFIRNSGKGLKEDALAFGLDEIERLYPGKFEYYSVFDADSVADANFLTEINKVLDGSGADCASGYYNSNNFGTNTVTKLCSIFYHGLMHASSLANDKLGLPVNIYGSGYAVKMKWRHLVPELETLVDDFELTLLMVLNRAKMVAAPRAVFYAEMPETFSEAMRQRKRWSFGDIQCYRKYVRRFRRAIFTHGLPALKQYIELIMNPFVSVTVIGIVLLCVVCVLKHLTLWLAAVFAAGIIVYYFGFFFIILATARKENIGFRHNEAAFFLMPLWITVSGYYAVVTLFMRRMTWHTPRRHG